MIITFIYLSVGLALLYFAGNNLVSKSTTLAINLRISPMIIGSTILGFGTSMPELTVSIDSILTDHPDIVIGNIIGSNIVNILIVLALGSLFGTIYVERANILSQGIMLLSITLLFILLCSSGNLTRIMGLLLLIVLFAYILKSIRQDDKPDNSINISVNKSEGTAKTLLYILLSVIFLAIGAHLFVEGSLMLGRTLGISEVVLGLTVIAIGTAAPEIAISIIAAIKKEGDLAIGNIIGSNIFNILGIAGVTSLVHPVRVDEHFIKVDIWILLAASLFLVIYGFFFKKIDKVFGIIALTMSAGYFYYFL